MSDAQQALHGDPEAMRQFAERLTGLDEPTALAPPPEAVSCTGGSQGCTAFTAADVMSTVALTDFLAETRDAIATLRDAAAVAADDYASTDEAGAQAVVVATAATVLAVSACSSHGGRS